MTVAEEIFDGVSEIFPVPEQPEDLSQYNSFCPHCSSPDFYFWLHELVIYCSDCMRAWSEKEDDRG